MTAAIDDGLPAATRRVMDVVGCYEDQDSNRTRYCPKHVVGWLNDVNACVRAEAVARAAREDVAETVREARASELEHFAERHVGIQSPGRMAEDLVERASAIRAGEQ